MSDFDVATSIDQNSMNAASTNVYQHIYPGFFKGSTSIDGSTISWDVQAPPAFDLTNISDTRKKVTDHLRRHKFQAPGDLDHDDIVDFFQQSVEPSSFKLNLPKVALTNEGTPAEAAFVVDCTINTAGGVLTLQAMKASFTTPDPSGWTKLIIQGILSEIMTIANNMLSGIDIPKISFEGISLTAPTVSVQANRVVVFFNLAGKPQPDIVNLSWPNDPFFLYLSDEAKNAIGAAATKNLSKTMNKSGSVGTSIGGASYHASAKISDINVSSAGSGTPTYNFSSNVSGGVGAKVTFLCIPIGVDYNLYAKPNPTGTINIGLNGTTISATTESVSPFVIVIDPTGSILEKILSAITDPILQAISAVFSPIISTFLRGITFDLGALPVIPISVSGYSITLSPSNMSLTSSNGYLAAVGELTIC